MNFNLHEAIELLERTPDLLTVFLSGLSDPWISCNEGEETWNVKEVVLHLIEGERSNWIPRLEFILKEGEKEAFPAFDRFAHLQNKELSLDEALTAFKRIRHKNLTVLKNLISSDDILEQKGFHPAFGTVRVRELIATWTVHDLTHVSQIARVMADHYRKDVGPWAEYLGILKKEK